jgi:hypothetical protein
VGSTLPAAAADAAPAGSAAVDASAAAASRKAL